MAVMAGSALVPLTSCLWNTDNSATSTVTSTVKVLDSVGAAGYFWLCLSETLGIKNSAVYLIQTNRGQAQLKMLSLSVDSYLCSHAWLYLTWAPHLFYHFKPDPVQYSRVYQQILIPWVKEKSNIYVFTGLFFHIYYYKLQIIGWC